MRKGKIAAQVAHASMGVLLQDSIKDQGEIGLPTLTIPMNSDMEAWLDGSFTKIVLYVNTNEEWYKLLETLDNQTEIPYTKITDNGATEFKGVKTETVVAIGPAEDWKIDAITGRYFLL